jgi:hypothetical protein
MSSRWVFVVAILLVSISFGCRPLPREASARDKLVAAKAAVMSADYRADLGRLAALRAEIAPLRGDPEVGYLADYWSGFAGWRLAINGANSDMKDEELVKHLTLSAGDLESSIQKKADFADAYAAAASVHGWLGTLLKADEPAMRAHYQSAKKLLTRAEGLEPSNPRVLWVRAGFYLFSPPAVGGDRARAVEIYHRQVDASGPLSPSSPLPDWGKVEALMSLSFAHLTDPEPDLDAAREEARAALALEPDWHYVRDILAPKIEAARR